MRGVNGLHHITAIAGPAQENLDFYAGVLGMQLVKRSVYQDDTASYHLFYADAEKHPGSNLTFLPWTQMVAPQPGHGLVMEVALEVPVGALDYWAARLTHYGTHPAPVETRFGQQVMPFIDPHGLRVALVQADKTRADADRARRFTPWDGSPVPAERQIRGLFGAQLWEREASATASFLITALGFEELASERGWTRYGMHKAAGVVDVRETPEARRGSWGVGSVHHLAWRVDDEEHQGEVRKRVEAGGSYPTTVVDRFAFKSVYFKEPGGVLFEVATDGPGLAVDEDATHFGEASVLPPWL